MRRTFLSLVSALMIFWNQPTCAAVLLNESFSYPDGPLVSVSTDLWTTFSGATGQVDVVSNRVFLTQAETEDVSAPLAGGPYSASSTNMY